MTRSEKHPDREIFNNVAELTLVHIQTLIRISFSLLAWEGFSSHERRCAKSWDIPLLNNFEI